MASIVAELTRWLILTPTTRPQYSGSNSPFGFYFPIALVGLSFSLSLTLNAISTLVGLYSRSFSYSAPFAILIPFNIIMTANGVMAFGKKKKKKKKLSTFEAREPTKHTHTHALFHNQQFNQSARLTRFHSFSFSQCFFGGRLQSRHFGFMGYIQSSSW